MGKKEVQQRMKWVLGRRTSAEKRAKTVRWSQLVRDVPEFVADPPPWGGPRGRPEVIVTGEGEFQVVDDTEQD